MSQIRITSKGIEKTLRRFSYLQAIAEYIWNGFDARATVVDLNLHLNLLGGVDQIVIADNGYGMNRQELEKKFTPFFESEKQIDPGKRLRTTSALHGKNGIGRLTFHRFASSAQWTTTYSDGAAYHTYTVRIHSSRLDTYETAPASSTREQIGTGTTVTFDHIIKDFDYEELLAFLSKEFGWFLELNADHHFDLRIDGHSLDYSGFIREKQLSTVVHGNSGSKFHIKYVQWTDRMNQEYSKLYFLDSHGTEQHKQPTTFNNKSDSYYHSVYIRSALFDHFDFAADTESEQLEFTSGADKRDEAYVFLIDEVNELIRRKRKPYLKIYADQVIQEFTEAQAFPAFLEAEEDRHRKEELESAIREMVQTKPKLFMDLNREQKRMMAHLLYLALGANERRLVIQSI